METTGLETTEAPPPKADTSLARLLQPRAPSKNAWLTFGVTFVLFAAWIGSGGGARSCRASP